MKRIFLLLSLLVLFQMTNVYAQIEDYILSQRGDTVVVKDDFEFGAHNALHLVVRDDTVNVPAGRVYELHKNGYYSLQNNPTIPAGQKRVIAGENMGLLKNYKGADLIPIVCGALWENGGSGNGGMTARANADLTVKNISISLGNPNQNVGWGWFGGDAGMKITMDNCMTEHTLWIQFQLPNDAKIYIKNSYIHNLTGFACRRNGGVIDFFAAQDTIHVENTTHVMAQGMMYKTRRNLVDRLTFNHNTFVNCAGLIFMDQGYQKNVSVTNNIFVNCQVQAYSGDPNFDPGECDLDPGTPMGFVNVAQLDSSKYSGSDIHFYVDNNVIYWDPKFSDIPSKLNTAAVGGYTTWTSQMITMNERTQNYFNDNANFPYLYEHNWISELPNFTDSKDLLDTQRDKIYDYAISVADPNSADILEMWRLTSTPASENFTYADMPIPVDLSYDNASLLTAAWGFPVGDLNWFPSEFARWSAQKDVEYAGIATALATGEEYVPQTAVEKVVGPANEFKLSQNYPNPFNPTTTISFSLPKDGFVTLKVYNAIGQEVATLLNGFRKAQTYNVEFDASNLPSGVYIYKIQHDNNTVSKKMVLMK